MDIVLLQTALNAAENLTFSGLVGALLTQYVLIKPSQAGCANLRIRLHRISVGFMLSTILFSLGLLWCEAALLGETGLGHAGQALKLVLSSTHYGHAGMLGIATLIVLFASEVFRKYRACRVWAGGLLIIVFAITRVSVSHAGEMGLVSVAAEIELVHLLAVAVWVGEVFIAGWVTLSTADQFEVTHWCPTYLTRLSMSATVALVCILVTGLFNVLRLTEHNSAMVNQPYFSALTIKLILVAGAIVLGGYNRFLVLPQLLNQHDYSATAFDLVRTILKFEFGLLVAAQVAAAILASGSPV